MVERPLSMREVSGSIPGFSKENKSTFAPQGNILFFFAFRWSFSLNYLTVTVTFFSRDSYFSALEKNRVLGRLLFFSGR